MTEEPEVPFPEVEETAPETPFPEVAAPTAQEAPPFPEVATKPVSTPVPPESGLTSGLKYAGKQTWKAVTSPVRGYGEIYNLLKEASKGTGGPSFGDVLAEYMRPNPENPEEAPSKEKSAGAFVGNVLKSTFRNVRDIGESLATAPVAGAKAAYDLYREATKNGEYHYDPAEVLKDWRDNVPRQLGDALVEKYTKRLQEQNPGHWETNPETGKLEKKDASLAKAIGEATYEDPFGVVTDAMAIKDLGAASLKAVGRTVGSESLIKTADRIAHIESEIAGKVGEKVLPAKWSEYLKNRREVLQYKGEENARARTLATTDSDSLLKDYSGLTPEESKAVRDVHLMGEGAPEESIQAVREGPHLQRAYESYRDYLKGNREAFLEDEGLLNRKLMDDRVAAQYAVAKYGNMEPDTLKLAKKDIAEMGEFKPVYVPTKREAEVLSSAEMIPFEKAEYKQGKVAFLERFQGKKPFYDTPQEYIPRVVGGFRKVEGNIRWIRKIQDSPDLVQAVSRAEAAGRENVIPTHGIYSKYFEGEGKFKAKAVFQRELTAKYGHDEAMRMLLDDAATKKRWRQISDIVANPAVRHILRFEFMHVGGIPGALLRGYDRILSVFRAGATKYNPHYYAGNAVGDAVLSLVNGTLPSHLRYGEKLKGLAPMQAMRAASTATEGFRGKLGTLFDYLNEVDASTKRGIIVKEVGQHLKDAGIRGFEFDRQMREILPSVENLSDAQMARGRIQERIAQKIETGNRLAREGKAAQKAVAVAQTAEEAASAQKAVAKIQRAKTKLSRELTGKMADSGAIERAVPEMAEKAAIVRPAIARANAFTGDYLGMGPVEQYVLRRLIPFYAFNKTMALLAFRLPFVAPKSTFLWNRYSAFLSSQMDDPENPDYLKNYFPMFVRENGDTVWASMKGLSPFGGVKRARVFGSNVPGVAAFWEQNPLISIGIRAVGGKTLFTRSSIPYGEMLTDAHNGSVYQFQENGSVRKVIDEPGLLKGISDYFPSIRLAEKILVPYQMAPEGWLLNPVPERDRAGQIVKKPSAWDHPGQVTLDMMGVRTLEKNAEQVKSQEAVKKAWIVREAIKEIKRQGDPDKRRAMIEHLKDFVQAGMEIEGGD